LSPLVFLPAMSYLGGSPLAAIALAGCLAGAILLLSPAGASWVVYNISPRAARDAVGAALRTMGVDFARRGDDFLTDAGRIVVTANGFLRLRNARRLEALEGPVSPMAVSMLLVAVVMLAVPLAMMAPDVPQIVRLLTDLLH
jgi:hypothetical protein